MFSIKLSNICTISVKYFAQYCSIFVHIFQHCTIVHSCQYCTIFTNIVPNISLVWIADVVQTYNIINNIVCTFPKGYPMYKIMISFPTLINVFQELIFPVDFTYPYKGSVLEPIIFFKMT